MSSNRRTYPRFDVIVPVRFRDAEDFLVQYTQNISQGGVFIQTTKPPKIGTELRLSLELPESRTAVPCKGTVSYVIDEERANETGQDAGVGVRFESIDPAAMKIIDAFVQMLEKRSRGTVLVVDDEPDIVHLLSELLRRNRFNVVTAFDGAEALRALERQPVAVILSDLSMPRLDGIEFRKCCLAKEEFSEIPFVILTANPDEESEELARELKLHSFLRKPISSKRLIEVLSGVFEDDEETRQDQPVSDHTVGVGLAARRLEELGLEVEIRGGVAEAELKITSTVLLNYVSTLPISKVTLGATGPTRLVFLEPEHVQPLAPIALQDVTSRQSLEATVVRAYQRRVEWVDMGVSLLERLDIPYQLYEPSFCVVGLLRVGAAAVVFTVRDTVTLVIETVDGEAFAPKVGSTHCIVDIANVEDAAGVRVAVQAVLDRAPSPAIDPNVTVVDEQEAAGLALVDPADLLD